MVSAYFEKNINVFVVLKYMLELNNVDVAQGFVNFDFSDELQ